MCGRQEKGGSPYGRYLSYCGSGAVADLCQYSGDTFPRDLYTEELQTAIDDYWDCDYIFIDTAGRSHQNAEQLEKMKEMVGGLKRPEDYQVFLVLSATTKYRDLQKIADCYGKIAKFELIFTKLDETEAVGNLLNIKLYTDAPIAYVTCGQNVPDDMEMFNPQKTVKQILGGKE